MTVVGTSFNNTGNITCRFGHREVPGELKSSSEIHCLAPQASEAGAVDLSISLFPGLYSSPVQYLFYETPTVTSIDPESGPESGSTLLTI